MTTVREGRYFVVIEIHDMESTGPMSPFGKRVMQLVLEDFPAKIDAGRLIASIQGYVADIGHGTADLPTRPGE